MAPEGQRGMVFLLAEAPCQVSAEVFKASAGFTTTSRSQSR